MARTPNAPDLSRQILRMQEQIRQLRLRKTGAAEPVEAWQALAPYVGTGWAVDGTMADALHARFYKDRDRVYFMGVLYFGGGAGSTPDKPIKSMPAGYAPKWLQNMMVFTDADNTISTTPDTRQEFWTAEALPPVAGGTVGQGIVLDQNKNFLAAPNNGFPPVLTVLYLDTLSYRLG